MQVFEIVILLLIGAGLAALARRIGAPYPLRAGAAALGDGEGPSEVADLLRRKCRVRLEQAEARARGVAASGAAPTAPSATTRSTGSRRSSTRPSLAPRRWIRRTESATRAGPAPSTGSAGRPRTGTAVAARAIEPLAVLW